MFNTSLLFRLTHFCDHWDYILYCLIKMDVKLQLVDLIFIQGDGGCSLENNTCTWRLPGYEKCKRRGFIVSFLIHGCTASRSLAILAGMALCVFIDALQNNNKVGSRSKDKDIALFPPTKDMSLKMH